MSVRKSLLLNFFHVHTFFISGRGGHYLVSFPSSSTCDDPIYPTKQWHLGWSPTSILGRDWWLTGGQGTHSAGVCSITLFTTALLKFHGQPENGLFTVCRVSERFVFSLAVLSSLSWQILSHDCSSLQAVEWPLNHRESFARLGISHPRGVLLYGPPGCAKTMLVRAAATACRVTFLAISGAQLYSPFVGDSERKISEVIMGLNALATAATLLCWFKHTAWRRDNWSQYHKFPLFFDLVWLSHLGKVPVVQLLWSDCRHQEVQSQLLLSTVT